MDEIDLGELLQGARSRLRSVSLSARLRLDLDALFRAMHLFYGIAQLPGEGQGGILAESWRLWGQNPASFRLEREVSGTLQLSGSGGGRIWSSDPDMDGALRSAWYSDPNHGRAEDFVELIGDPVLEELLDPQGLWDILDGVEADVTYEMTEDSYLARPILRIEATLRDVEVNLWNEAIRPGDRHAIWVDKESGILLRVGCWFEGAEYSVIETTSLDINGEIDPQLFEAPI